MAHPTEMHSLLVRALTEDRRRDVSDSHDLGHRDPHHLLDVVAYRGDAATRFATGDDMGQRVVRGFGRGHLQVIRQVLGERGGRQQRVGEPGAKREQDSFRVARPHRQAARADSKEREMRVPGDERTSSERGQNAAVLVDPCRVIRPSTHHCPGLHVCSRQGEDRR